MLLALIFGLLGNKSAEAGEYDIWNADERLLEVIGWSADESLFAVRQYDIRSDNFSRYNSSSRAPSDCPGYTRADGQPLSGGYSIIVYDQNKMVKSRYPVMDSNQCTHPNDAANRIQAAMTGLAEMGIGTNPGTVLELKGDKAEEGQYFTVHNERFKVEGEKTPVGDGFAFDFTVDVIHRKGTYSYKGNIKCKGTPDLREPPPAEPVWGLEKALVAPSGNRVLMHQYLQCPYFRRVVTTLGIFDWTGSEFQQIK